MAQWRSLGWVTVLALALAACDDSSSSTFSSGVDSNKQLSQLSPTELNKVCTGSAEFLADSEAVKQLQCKSSSLSSLLSGGAPACDQAYEACLKGDAGVSIDIDAGVDDAGVSDAGAAPACTVPASCTATVGEYDKCVNDGRKVIENLNSAFKKCDLNSVTGLDAAAFEEPASCIVMDQKCPGMLSSPVPSDGFKL